LYIKGDATHDEIIQQAGLDKTVGVIAALPDEKDNLFVTMSLSQKKKDTDRQFRIGAKVTHLGKMAPKLRSAGADYVISPEHISSRRMVSEMFRPAVTTFLDRMLKDDRAVMRFEEVTVAPGSTIAGKTLKDSHIPVKAGLVIVAVRKGGTGGFIYNPGADQKIDEGDVLIAMGAIHKINVLRKLSQ
jgi:voltage-gated potassium channel